MINAVIYILPENYGVSAARCLDYCAAKHYNVVGLIPGDRRAAMQMLSDGSAGVVVVSSAGQLDPGREPRIEVVPKRFAARRRSASTPPRPAAGSPATTPRRATAGAS